MSRMNLPHNHSKLEAILPEHHSAIPYFFEQRFHQSHPIFFFSCYFLKRSSIFLPNFITCLIWQLQQISFINKYTVGLFLGRTTTKVLWHIRQVLISVRVAPGTHIIIPSMWILALLLIDRDKWVFNAIYCNAYNVFPAAMKIIFSPHTGTHLG